MQRLRMVIEDAGVFLGINQMPPFKEEQLEKFREDCLQIAYKLQAAKNIIMWYPLLVQLKVVPTQENLLTASYDFAELPNVAGGVVKGMTEPRQRYRTYCERILKNLGLKDINTPVG